MSPTATGVSSWGWVTDCLWPPGSADLILVSRCRATLGVGCPSGCNPSATRRRSTPNRTRSLFVLHLHRVSSLSPSAVVPDQVCPTGTGHNFGNVPTRPPSSTWLGWSGALAVGAVAEDLDDRDLEVFQGLVEAQAAPAAFGLAVRRWSVMNRCAAVTRVVWWCQPWKVRPSKWSRPRPCLSSR